MNVLFYALAHFLSSSWVLDFCPGMKAKQQRSIRGATRSRAAQEDIGETVRTCDKITSKPLQIVGANPLEEGKEGDNVIDKETRPGEGFADPFGDGGLFLDKGIGRLDGEDGFTAGDAVLGLVGGVQLDPQHLGHPMPSLGDLDASHCARQVGYRGRSERGSRAKRR